MLGRDDASRVGASSAPAAGAKAFQSARDAAEASTSLAWIELPSGDRFPVGADCSLGRSRSNHIVLANEKVSRCHAQIQFQEPNSFWLSDLGSSNGTWLNGKRISEPVPLFDRDSIQLGAFTLLFRHPSGTSRSPSSSPPRVVPERRAVTCWLLLASYGSTLATALAKTGEGEASMRAQWLDGCQQIIEQRGGSVTKYFEAGFMALWQDRTGTHSAVAHAVAELAKLQTKLPHGTRLALHHGSVTLGGTTLSGGVSGQSVSFLFRTDRLAESLKVPLVISEAAQQALGDSLSFVSLGKHTVSGFEGDFSFFRIQ